MNLINTLDRMSDIDTQRPFLSKSEYVYRLLKDKIMNGYLERNKIYTIVEIAENLGISRTPVGEAVKILGSQNYIILYQGVGFKVKEISTADIGENLLISGAMEEVVLKKIIRDGITATDKLQEAVSRSWKAVENQAPELYTQASADFHRIFFALSGLPKVIEILRENVFVNEMWYRKGAGLYPETIKRLISDHENIIRLIQESDTKQVSEVINTHVANCETLLNKVILE